jgi:hypothetical protein
MDTQGISAGSNLALAAQKASNEEANETSPEQATETSEKTNQSFLSKLEVLGPDHPLTKFLGGFWSQHVDVEA